MFSHLGPTELLIILAIVLAIFGAGKIASLGGALGKGVRDFRKEIKSGVAPEEPAAPLAPADDKPTEPHDGGTAA